MGAGRGVQTDGGGHGHTARIRQSTEAVRSRAANVRAGAAPGVFEFQFR